MVIERDGKEIYLTNAELHEARDEWEKLCAEDAVLSYLYGSMEEELAKRYAIPPGRISDLEIKKMAENVYKAQEEYFSSDDWIVYTVADAVDEVYEKIAESYEKKEAPAIESEDEEN